jgi:hypothetical protein
MHRPAVPDGDRAVNHAARAFLVATALIVLILSGLRANVFWRNEAYLDDASGHSTALAKDLAEGTFYRPLHDADGYGGTRHLPLRFVLHAGLMRVLGDPIRSGFLLSGLSMLLLVGGVYLLLRRLGCPAVVAASCAAMTLAVHPAQEALLTIKSDGLAAALNIWGVALCAGSAVGAATLAAAAAAFAMAFATKMTTVSGLAAVVLWFAFSGRMRRSVQLLLSTVAGMVTVLLLMQLFSHGTAFEVIRASATGGATARDILLAPFTLARQARRVPETLVFIQLGCAALLLLLFGAPKALAGLPSLLFLSVFAVTTVIFGSPGTDTNHFLDLHVASIVLVAVWFAQREHSRLDFGVVALTVAALAACLSLASGLVNAKTEQRRGLFADALKYIPDRSRPILAQNPLLPVAAGQRAYLLDPFLIRVIAERDPAFGEPLWDDFRRQRFAAVVLELDPRNERAQAMYRSALLGERFMEELDRNYELAATVGLRTVYLPRRNR